MAACRLVDGLKQVTCGLTACTPGSAPGPTLGNDYGRTLPVIITCVMIQVELGMTSSGKDSAAASSEWRELRAQVQFLDDECRTLRRKVGINQGHDLQNISRFM